MCVGASPSHWNQCNICVRIVHYADVINMHQLNLELIERHQICLENIDRLDNNSVVAIYSLHLFTSNLLTCCWVLQL